MATTFVDMWKPFHNCILNTDPKLLANICKNEPNYLFTSILKVLFNDNNMYNYV